MFSQRRQRFAAAYLTFMVGISTVFGTVIADAAAPFAAFAQSGTPGVVRNSSAPESVWTVGHGEYCQQSTAAPGITEEDAIAVDMVNLRSSRSEALYLAQFSRAALLNFGVLMVRASIA